VSNNRLDLGLDELREALRNLPAELTGEASHIVEGAANGAAAQIKAKYARRTGKLGDGVSVEKVSGGRFSAGAIVKNTAKIAFVFENGTQARHTAIGANRGSMPPGHVFVPIVIRKRRQMNEQLIDLLQRNGLVVTDDASGF
jgi:hypothetical protein